MLTPDDEAELDQLRHQLALLDTSVLADLAADTETGTPSVLVIRSRRMTADPSSTPSATATSAGALVSSAAVIVAASPLPYTNPRARLDALRSCAP